MRAPDGVRHGEEGDLLTACAQSSRTRTSKAGSPITGDLTVVEVDGTIFSIAESTHRAGEIWVGTDELHLGIHDAQGQLVRTLSSVPRPNRYAPDDADDPEEPNKGELTRKQGLQRVVWDLRHESAKRLHAKIDAGNPDRGPLVLPGRYRLRLRVGERLLETEVEILPDPSSPATPADLEQDFRVSLELRAALDRITDLVEELRSIRT